MDVLKHRRGRRSRFQSARRGVLLLAGIVIAAEACVYDYQALRSKSDPAGGGSGGEVSATGGATVASSGGEPGGVGGLGGAPVATGGSPATGTGGRVTGSGGSGAAGGRAGGGDGGNAGRGGGGAGGRALEGGGGAQTGGAGGGAASAGAGGHAPGTAGMGAGGLGAGGLGASGGRQAGGAPGNDPDLVLLYGFDEGAGTTANDTSGFAGGPRAAQLGTAGTGGTIAFSTTHQLGSASLSMVGNRATGGGYLTTPGLASLSPGALTIAVWVNLAASSAWQRIFDYGTGTTQYLFLTPTDSSGNVRFAITKNGSASEERIMTTKALPMASWHHVAVVLQGGSPYTGTLYVDGAAAGTNMAMTLHAQDLGVTTNNYLGRSAFTADPYLSAFLDDYRVYRRALTASEITALFAAR